MATTLGSAGGTSQVTDGTGPSLEIKGWVDTINTKVETTTTTLAIRAKRESEMNYFFDDFPYHCYNTALNIDAAASPFVKSKIWQVSSFSGAGTAIATVARWDSPKTAGTIFFNNAYSSGPGIYELKARGVSMDYTCGDLTYETKIWLDTTIGASGSVLFGLTNTSGTQKIQIEIITTGGHVVVYYGNTYQLTSFDYTNLYSTWAVLKIVIATTGTISFYINGTLISTQTSALSGSVFLFPSMKVWRGYGTSTKYDFFVDYIEYYANITGRQ